MRPLYVCHAPFTEWILAASMYRKGDLNFRSPGRPWPGLAFEGLELCDGKLSRTVLRGLGAGNSPRLPGWPDIWFSVVVSQVFL
jgi:hypothetical protein